MANRDSLKDANLNGVCLYDANGVAYDLLGLSIVTTPASSLSLTQNALSTSAEVVIAENTGRHFAEVKNTDTTISIYVGMNNTVSSSTGYLVKAGEAFGFENYTGAIWAIAASGTPTVTTIEW